VSTRWDGIERRAPGQSPQGRRLPGQRGTGRREPVYMSFRAALEEVEQADRRRMAERSIEFAKHGARGGPVDHGFGGRPCDAGSEED